MMDKKILIVEDEVRISNLLKMYLERESYQVEVNDNGIDGLENALSQNFDLVILDIFMPGKDGFQVLEELRQVKTTPVMMLSAKGGENDEELAKKLGANAFLLKPFSPRDIVNKINELLVHSI